MNPETNAPVVELESLQELQQRLTAEYAISPDGTIVKVEDLENPETPQELMR
jgi:hypothetical protein